VSTRPAPHPAGGQLTAGSLCTGYGGLDLAVMAVTGARLAWVAETDKYAAAVLGSHWPDVPNLGDITALDWASVPPVDLVTAGWPCQDISYAGGGAGITEGTRSGLWLHIADGLRYLRPAYVFLENVAALRTRGLARVLADLAALVSAFLPCLGFRGAGTAASACGLR
jgi:DNA (cytosine-5)-methyltransferase 1